MVSGSYLRAKLATFELQDFVVQFKTAFGSGRSGLNLSDVYPSIRVAGRRFRIVLINASSKLMDINSLLSRNP